MAKIVSVTVEQLAGLVPAEPPGVLAAGVESRDVAPHGQDAALLVWARHFPSRQWIGGISWIYSKTRGALVQALLTCWVPAAFLAPCGRQSYRSVRRVLLTGPADDWPRLPPVYPRVDSRWADLHLHARRPDPSGEYHELREAMRELQRRR